LLRLSYVCGFTVIPVFRERGRTPSQILPPCRLPHRGSSARRCSGAPSRGMFRSDFLCASDATRHAAWQHTSFAHVFAVFQAPGVGSARGYLIPQRRFGRVLACDPPHPNAFASGHVHAWSTLCMLVLAGGRIV
jgi:hypothetical protein